ncbi:phage holin family protein [Actinoplanes sp. NPDC051470]|uniref:phage holin family protein n=1 Tax=Actinoplanes sp. NPDC051470 TaxID=3157224 RepID=UPI003438BDE6
MADVLNGSAGRKPGEQSTSELVQRASEQITLLVRDELALAKAELAEKGKHAGIGIGLFGGGGVLALYGVGALIATGIIALSLVLPLWLAALIVTVVLFAVAGVLALLGKKQVTQAVPPGPEAAIESVKADVDEVKHAVKDRSRA